MSKEKNIRGEIKTPLVNSPKELEELRKKILSKRDPNKPCITLSSGTCGRAYGRDKVAAAFVDELRKQGLNEKIVFRETG